MEEQLRAEYFVLSPDLNERARRRWAGFQARKLGHGGQAIVHRATGISYPTIRKGIQEISSGEEVNRGRLRQPGGGRKSIVDKQPGLVQALQDLVESTTRGDPESSLRWTCKSVRNLQQALIAQGYNLSHQTVSVLLAEQGYSLQANRKTSEGSEHPDRDAQFGFIKDKVKDFQHSRQPVISVDTKKKELIGEYKNGGREYHKKGQAPQVNVYDFLDKEKGKAAPYGVYDLDKNKGWVSVGISSDTAEFAVNSIRRWWFEMGKDTYEGTTALYINADGGGSNGARNRLWKRELQKLANELKMDIHVSHFPPGTSKWNKIEHRMFSFISINWRGKPLLDTATIVNLISNTTTKTGLEIKAALDENIYQKGIKVSDEDFQKINLQKDSFHGEWNYIIQPN